MDTLLIGLYLPRDNAHAPNESFHLGMMRKGKKLLKGILRSLREGRALRVREKSEEGREINRDPDQKTWMDRIALRTGYNGGWDIPVPPITIPYDAHENLEVHPPIAQGVMQNAAVLGAHLDFTPTALNSKAQRRVAHAGLPTDHPHQRTPTGFHNRRRRKEGREINRDPDRKGTWMNRIYSIKRRAGFPTRPSCFHANGVKLKS